MRYNLYLTWRNLLQNPIATFVPAIIIALAVALSLGVFALGDGVRQEDTSAPATPSACWWWDLKAEASS
ncbi:MAG UNVERIFIED_CONTAM: hypothetical protein LVT10_11230 [Anaerolineae bacterium]|jgi:hypothetical protein